MKTACTAVSWKTKNQKWDENELGCEYGRGVGLAEERVQ